MAKKGQSLNTIQIVMTIVVLAIAIASYIYLDWGVLQITGVGFVVLLVYEIDEEGPAWRKSVWALLSFLVMVLAHFFVPDNAIYWIGLGFSALLFLAATASIIGLLNHKPGDGSTATLFFIILVISLPVGLLILYNGMVGLGYW